MADTLLEQAYILEDQRDSALERGRELLAALASERAGGAGAIAAERQRQIIAEGYTVEHDRHTPVRTLVQAAGAYLGLARWPWAPQFFKFDDGDGYYRRRNLVKAGALIAAAIDRMDNVGEGQ